MLIPRNETLNGGKCHFAILNKSVLKIQNDNDEYKKYVLLAF